MVVGSFGKLLGTYVVSVRLVDVETGTVLYGATARGKTEDEVGGAIRKLAAAIAGK
jgi:curli biogenesis system outer membrane secretion channel CsgG